MLTICLVEFEDITVDECINYKLYSQLERKVKTTVDTYKKIEHIDELKDETLHDFLEFMLLNVGNCSEWISASKKFNLDQRYLYTVIKKQVLLKKN